MKVAHHPSSSDEQQRAEVDLVRKLSKEIGVALNPKDLQADGSRFQVDGYSDDPPVLAEAYAHVGRLKGSQPDKVMMDAFKMLFYEKSSGREFKKMLLFADATACDRFKGSSWQAACLKKFGIEPWVVGLPEATKSQVTQAQMRQRR